MIIQRVLTRSTPYSLLLCVKQSHIFSILLHRFQNVFTLACSTCAVTREERGKLAGHINYITIVLYSLIHYVKEKLHPLHYTIYQKTPKPLILTEVERQAC